MGVTLTANNSAYAFHMGGGGFFSLRAVIADALDAEFGKNYRTILYCRSREDYERHDEAANRLLEEKELDEDIVEFLYMPDEGGSVSHRTCGKILKLLEKADLSGKGFQYAAYRKDDYGNLRKFLGECYSHRRKMRWE